MDQQPTPRQTSAQMQDALGVVLQSTNDLKTVLRVMMSGKRLREAVLSHCTGALDVALPTNSSHKRAKDFIAWLSKYGSLAGYLSLDGDNCKSWMSIEADIIAALQQAAATPAGLRIHDCSMHCLTLSNGVKILEQLPPTRLTSLVINFLDNNHRNQALIQQVNNAIGRLTALRDLSINTGTYDLDFTSTHHYVTGLSSLTSLTSLILAYIGNGKALTHLPVSLKELKLSRNFECAETDCLHLGHLTAVTNLVGDSFAEVCFHAGDVLPPNLLELEAADVRHAAVLLPLTKLQNLHLSAVEMPAGEMQQLSSLTALTDVQLEHHSSSSVDNAAAGWSALKGLHTLYLEKSPDYPSLVLTASAVDGLSKLSSITSLTMKRLSIQLEATAAGLAQAFKGLVGLQQLTLTLQQEEPEDQETVWVEARAAETLLSAAAAIPALTTLRVGDMHMTSTAAVQLAAAAAPLTSLTFGNCNVDDTMINTLVLRLPQLQRLIVTEREKPRPRGFITDAVLPALASRPTLAWSFRGASYITRKGMELFFPET